MPPKGGVNPYATTYSPAPTVPDKDDEVHLKEDAQEVGKMASPTCTDVPCCLVFLAFLAGMVYVFIYGLHHGDPRRLTHGFDYAGRLCGVDENVTDKKLLFWCPEPRAPGTVATSLYLETPICIDSCPDSESVIVACPQPQSTQSQETGDPPFTIRTTVVVERNVPTRAYPSTEFAGMYCVPRPDYSQHLEELLFERDGPLGSYSAQALTAVGSLENCWRLLIGSVALAVVLGYIYLILLKLFAKPLVFTLTAFIILGFLAIGCFFLFGDVVELTGCCDAEEPSTSTANATTTPATNTSFDLASYGATGILADWRDVNPLYHEFDEESATQWSRVIGTAGVILGFLCICLFCCLLSSIEEALGVIEAACDCLFKMPALFLFPLVEVLLKMSIAIALIVGLLWVASTGEVEAETVTVNGEKIGGLKRNIAYTDEEVGFIAFYIFGFFWLMEFVNAFGQFVVAYMVVDWYYTDHKGCGPPCACCQGMFVGLVFHAGTLALGSFAIATLRFFRAIMTMVASKTDDDGHGVGACLTRCCICCLECFEQCLKYVNKNAYIDVAISSTSFFTAAKNVMTFIASAAGTIFILNGACFVFSAVGVLAIALATGLFTYVVLVNNDRWMSDTSAHHVSNPEFVACVAALLGALVATGFMTVFDHTADTLLYTFEWNRQHAHNTADKYAPDSLKSLVGYSKKEGSKGSKAEGGGGGILGFFGFGGSKSRGGTSGTAEEKSSLLGGSSS